MKRIMAIMLALFAHTSMADEYVHGYTRNNGTYVQGYERTSPNNTKYDNYSSQGNTNPYTGQQGYQNPNPLNSGSGYGSQSNYGSSNSSSGYNYGYGR